MSDGARSDSSTVSTTVSRLLHALKELLHALGEHAYAVSLRAAPAACIELSAERM